MPNRPTPLADSWYKNISQYPAFRAGDVSHAYRSGDQRSYNLHDELRHPHIDGISLGLPLFINRADQIDLLLTCTFILQNYQAVSEVISLSINGIDIMIDTPPDTFVDGENMLSLVLTEEQRSNIITSATNPGRLDIIISLRTPPDDENNQSDYSFSFYSITNFFPYRNRDHFWVSSIFGNASNAGTSPFFPKASIMEAIQAITTDSLSDQTIIGYDDYDELDLTIPTRIKLFIPEGSLRNSIIANAYSQIDARVFNIVSADAFSGDNRISLAWNSQLRLQTLESEESTISFIIGTDGEVNETTCLSIVETSNDLNVNIQLLGTGHIKLELPDTITVNFLDINGDAIEDDPKWYGRVNGILRHGIRHPKSNTVLFVSDNGSSINDGLTPESPITDLSIIDFTEDQYEDICMIQALDSFSGWGMGVTSLSIDRPGLIYYFPTNEIDINIDLNPNQTLIAKRVNGDIGIAAGQHETTEIRLDEHNVSNRIVFSSSGVTGRLRVEVKDAPYTFDSLLPPDEIVLYGTINGSSLLIDPITRGRVLRANNAESNSITLGSNLVLDTILLHLHAVAPNGVNEAYVIAISGGLSPRIDLLLGSPTGFYTRLNALVLNDQLVLSVSAGVVGNLVIQWRTLSSL